MNKIAAYEMILEGHPLWEKEAAKATGITSAKKLKNLKVRELLAKKHAFPKTPTGLVAMLRGAVK